MLSCGLTFTFSQTLGVDGAGWVSMRWSLSLAGCRPMAGLTARSPSPIGPGQAPSHVTAQAPTPGHVFWRGAPVQTWSATVSATRTASDSGALADRLVLHSGTARLLPKGRIG